MAPLLTSLFSQTSNGAQGEDAKKEIADLKKKLATLESADRDFRKYMLP
jgi:hypothetical protein